MKVFIAEMLWETIAPFSIKKIVIIFSIFLILFLFLLAPLASKAPTSPSRYHWWFEIRAGGSRVEGTEGFAPQKLGQTNKQENDSYKATKKPKK